MGLGRDDFRQELPKGAELLSSTPNPGNCSQHTSATSPYRFEGASARGRRKKSLTESAAATWSGCITCVARKVLKSIEVEIDLYLKTGKGEIEVHSVGLS